MAAARRLARTLWRSLRLLFLALLLLGLALRLAVELSPSLAGPAERIATAALGVPVTIGEAEPVWRGWRPALVLADIHLEAPDATVRVEHAAVTPAPWASLRAGAPRWASGRATGIEITAHEPRDGWAAHLLRHQLHPELRQLPRRFALREATLRLAPREGPAVESVTLAADGAHDGETVRLGVLGTDEAGEIGGGVRLNARLPLERPGSGTVFVGLDDVPVAPWGEALSAPRAEGRLSGRLWLDLAEGRPQALDGRLQGRGLALEPRRPMPGLEGLHVDARLQGRSVEGRLAVADGALDLPWLFAEPIGLDRAGAGLSARWGEAGVERIALDGARARNADAQARGRAALTLDGDEAGPHLRVDAEASGAPVQRAPAYVPHGVTPASVREWLAASLRGGTLEHARVRLDGRPGDFPFDDGAGVFRTVAEVTGGELHYDPAWPAIRDIEARLRFEGAGMAIEGRGETFGAELDPVRVGIADLRRPWLDVSGRARADAARALDFVAASPLGGGSAVPERLGGAGPLTVDLDLALPLALPRPEAALVEGRVDLDGVRLAAEPWGRVSGLEGEVRFDPFGVRTERPVIGQWQGEPLRLSARTDRAEDRIRIDAAGRGTPRGALGAVLGKAPAWLEGSAPWRLHADLPAFQPRPRPWEARVSARSRLDGLALELPAPLGVAADEERLLEVELGLTEGGPSYWLRLGDRLLRAGAAAGPSGRLRSAVVELGGASPRLPEQGVRIGGRLDELDISAWQAWLARQAPDGDALGDAAWLPPKPWEAHLRISDLAWAGRRYGPQVLAVEAFPQEAVRFAARGDLVTGSGHGTLPGGEVEVQLEHLDLPVPEAAARAEVPGEPGPGEGPLPEVPEALRPAAWPEVAISVESLRLDGREAGRVRLSLGPTAEGLYLDALTLRGGAVALSGSGVWHNDHTAVRGRLRSDDVGDLLTLLGAERAVSVADVDVVAELRWPGAPWQARAGDLLGALELRMRDGRITTVEPGAGRLVGLLGVRLLPRRILLDFGDIFGEGFAFDTLDGVLVAEGGTARIEELGIEGSAARIDVAGRVDLEQRTYDSTVTVEPRIGGLLPAIGALLGGGVGAAGGLLADQLLGEGFDRAAAIRYRVEGPWHDPRVLRIGAEDGE